MSFHETFQVGKGHRDTVDFSLVERPHFSWRSVEDDLFSRQNESRNFLAV